MTDDAEISTSHLTPKEARKLTTDLLTREKKKEEVVSTSHLTSEEAGRLATDLLTRDTSSGSE